MSMIWNPNLPSIVGKVRGRQPLTNMSPQFITAINKVSSGLSRMGYPTMYVNSAFRDADEVGSSTSRHKTGNAWDIAAVDSNYMLILALMWYLTGGRTLGVSSSYLHIDIPPRSNLVIYDYAKQYANSPVELNRVMTRMASLKGLFSELSIPFTTSNSI